MDSPGYRVPANGSVDPRAVCHSRHHHTTDAESEGLVPGSTAPRRRRCSLARIVRRPFERRPSVEARADDVQLCLSERALHAEHKAVVELGWIVTAVLVDHERAGDGAQLEQAMPVLV